jgi:hypothetical protein
MSEREHTPTAPIEYRDVPGHPGESPERWRDVVGYEGLYQVSTWGQMKSVARMKRTRWGGLMAVPERIMKQTVLPGVGYRGVQLCKDRKYTHFLVHRLVLEAFVGPCPEGMVCRHFPDRDPANNRLDNLSWGTGEQNQADRVAHGTDGRGAKNPHARLKESDVRALRHLHATGLYTLKTLGDAYGVHLSTVFNVVRHRNWKHA